MFVWFQFHFVCCFKSSTTLISSSRFFFDLFVSFSLPFCMLAFINLLNKMRYCRAREWERKKKRSKGKKSFCWWHHANKLIPSTGFRLLKLFSHFFYLHRAPPMPCWQHNTHFLSIDCVDTSETNSHLSLVRSAKISHTRKHQKTFPAMRHHYILMIKSCHIETSGSNSLHRRRHRASENK